MRRLTSNSIAESHLKRHLRRFWCIRWHVLKIAVFYLFYLFFCYKSKNKRTNVRCKWFFTCLWKAEQEILTFYPCGEEKRATCRLKSFLINIRFSLSTTKTLFSSTKPEIKIEKWFRCEQNTVEPCLTAETLHSEPKDCIFFFFFRLLHYAL